LLRRVVWEIGTNVSEKPAVRIFKGEGPSYRTTL